MADVPEDKVPDLGLEIFDYAPVGVAVTRGRDHRLVYTNPVHDAIVGERPLGEPLSRAYEGLVGALRYSVLYDQVLETGEPMYVAEAPIFGEFTNGSQEHFFSFSLSPVEFADGERGVLFVGIDVTEQVTASRRIRTLSEERRRALQRFESLVKAGSQIVWVASPQGRAIEPSPNWEKITGQTWEEFRGEGWLNALHPDDRKPTMESWQRALKEVQPLWQHTYRLRMADGSYRHFRARAVPVREGDVVVEWVGTCTDVEQQWQEERRAALLDRAAGATSGMTRLEEILQALCHVIVPELADGCAVYLLPDSPTRPRNAPLAVERVAAATRDGLPRMHVPCQEWFAPFSGFAQAVRRRRPVHATFPTGEPPPGIASESGEPPSGIASESMESWLADASINSIVLLPLIVDGDVAAVVTAAVSGDRRPISTSDVALMDEMLDHAHAPLSGALELRRAQRVALALQNSLLAEPPEIPGMQITARYRPSPEAAEVGGDWYDSFVLPDGTPIVTIGDVAGHDLPAAVTMSQLRNMLRGLVVDRQEPPGEVLRRLNLAMGTLCPDQMATCILARVEGGPDDGWRMIYSVAGHPPPLLVYPDGRARYLLGGHNALLGVLPDVPRTSAMERLEPGCTVLFYTDGLIEHPGEPFDMGMSRLRERASPLARAPLDRFCDKILANLATTGKDDVAMIAFRVGRPPQTDESR
ncbi:SpoIIE family protein phosphatase [Thermostaphylospora chromogena]|nr:SpoIIE family protein phosphatase [Thermostaphylospora chromogena]